MSNFDFNKERKLEQFFRSNKWLLLLVTIIVSGLLYLGIYWSMLLFNQGNYWAILISGLLGHSFFVILMHDGAHQSLTRTKWDHVIMNVSAGLIILPVYTELFKKYHLLHHAHTNTEKDPLWNGFKERLFNERRMLYAILQCIPFAFNFYVVLQSKKETTKVKSNAAPNIYLILLSLVVAGCIIYFAQPNIWFVLGSFLVMTTLGAIRYWGEHMGTSKNKESNTHWFPLGMGIGNHEVHHHRPDYSWLTLTIGLLYRKMDTNPLKSIKGIFFDRNFRHYKKG